MCSPPCGTLLDLACPCHARLACCTASLCCGLWGCGDGPLVVAMAVPAGRCAVCPGGAPPEPSEMPICPVSAVCKTQAKQRSCIVHDCKKSLKSSKYRAVLSAGLLGVNLDIFSADPEGQCEYFILDLSDPLRRPCQDPEKVTDMLYESLRTSLRVPDDSYGPY